MSRKMKRIVLASRPDGRPTDANFRLEELDAPEPQDGEVLVAVEHISLDPYMRGRMDDAKSYATPVPVDGLMEGGGVGEVVASKHPDFHPGDKVFGMTGWATHACLPGDQLRKLDPDQAPLTAALGVLGMPGFTGWYGFTRLGRPNKGETLAVAAATGPVGSMVGQLAKAYGLRAVGIAGGPEKCALAQEKFGFDACIDHRAFDDAASLRKAIAAEAPDGIDIYFENVGGKVQEAVLPLMNTFGRIPLCGMVSAYNQGALGGKAGEGPDKLPLFMRSLLVKRMSVSGFIIADHYDEYGAFLKEVGPMVGDGRVTFEEDVAEGLENAPDAFLGMLEGRNRGKQLVKVG
ncbi:zinc-binding dehydrogenase [Aquicoccus sp. SCR17]|nr:zinc-binding dehydrogenase [Carideicomes alvinocaridis]